MTPMPRDDHDHDAADAAAISRQKMLTRATIGLGSAMGAIIAAPAAVAVLAPVFKQVKSYPVDIGRATLYPEVEPGKIPWHTATFESAPDDGSGLARRLVYIRNDGDGKFTAISNTWHRTSVARCRPTRPDSPAPATAASTTARAGASPDRPCAHSTVTTRRSTTGAT